MQYSGGRDLYRRSIDIIRAGQSATGAYIAAPDYPTYAYSWLRDGSFIAAAMLGAGETESALMFMGWAHQAIVGQKGRVDKIYQVTNSGGVPGARDMLPARYGLDGNAADDDWPNFQIDGYGTWLWLVARFAKALPKSDVLATFGESIRISVRYLKLVWKLPNYDCWEEFGDKIHPASLACVCGGLNDIGVLLGDASIIDTASNIKAFILDHISPVGRFPKFLGSTAVDASLLWLALPFGVIDASDPAMMRTVAEIERKIVRNDGVHRYAEDTYYGGGQWIILNAWLAWYYLEIGKKDRALALTQWIERHADASLRLPEQVTLELNDPAWLPVWEKRWGTSAMPLLWSHAMFMTVYQQWTERSVTGQRPDREPQKV